MIRRFQCGHPDPFRSVRYLGFVASRCSHPSGELRGRSSVWLPAWLPSFSAGRPAGQAVDGFQVSIVATFCTVGGGPAVGSAP